MCIYGCVCESTRACAWVSQGPSGIRVPSENIPQHWQFTTRAMNAISSVLTELLTKWYYRLVHSSDKPPPRQLWCLILLYNSSTKIKQLPSKSTTTLTNTTTNTTTATTIQLLQLIQFIHITTYTIATTITTTTTTKTTTSTKTTTTLRTAVLSPQQQHLPLQQNLVKSSSTSLPNVCLLKKFKILWDRGIRPILLPYSLGHLIPS